MSKFHPMRRIRRVWRQVYHRAASYVRLFGKQTEEVLTEEPIDFSAPSIPYYENLANRFSFIRVVLYMVLFVFVVVTVVSNHTLITYENLYYLAKDIGAATLTAQSEADHISYPISSADSDFALFRGGVAIAGSEVVTVMSGSGRQTLSVNVDYANPCVRASDKYCLTFGRGENSFSVYNAFVQVYRESTDFPVYGATVGDNGTFAIVTRSRDYTSEVIIYDSNFNKLANYHLNGYVTGLSMNAAGDRLGAVSVEANEGVWETKITLIRIGSRISQESATVTGSFGSTCGYITDDRFAVVMSDRLMVWESDATVTGETDLNGSDPILCAAGNGRVAILSQADSDLSENLLQVFDKNGREVYRVRMDTTHPICLAGGATHMAFGGNILFIRAGDKLFRVTGDGEDITSASISRDTLAILPQDGDEVLVCTPAYASRLERDDFESESS